jgi:hypothetical protein
MAHKGVHLKACGLLIISSLCLFGVLETMAAGLCFTYGHIGAGICYLILALCASLAVGIVATNSPQCFYAADA